MSRIAGRVSIVVLAIFILGAAAPADAFSFCFSPGGSSKQSSYAAYPPPYPLMPQAGYGAYPYSPQQFDPYYGVYYQPLSLQPYDGSVMPVPQGYR